MKSNSTKLKDKTPSPKGKHPGGRPPLYSSPEQMEKAIQAYFDSCWETEVMENDGQKAELRRQIRPYTMSGLANSIGMSRRTLIDYAQKDEFLPTIKKAREKVHQYVEEYLFQGKNTAGAIFNLKNNFGWVDKQDIEHSGGIKVVSHDPIKKPKESGTE